jgi:HD superfamily phosphodiesterase
MQVSRKKYQEALRCLKDACKNDKLPWAQRLRAAELICAIYGTVELEDSKRDRRAVKELVTERAFEKQLNEEVRSNILEKTAKQAEEDAKAFLAKLNTGEHE